MQEFNERCCGLIHDSVWAARDCAERQKRSSESFGSLTEGINLWWGEKYTPGRLKNLGFVIGLRNREAGIGWRLDYDEKKGAHLNQVNRAGVAKRWIKIYHPIKFQTSHVIYDEEYWVNYWWRRWTSMNATEMPERVRAEMEKWGVSAWTRML